MGSSDSSRLSTNALFGTSAELSHPILSEADVCARNPYATDAADLFASNWESAWIDIGGEG
jgi:hypothetical protein